MSAMIPSPMHPLHRARLASVGQIKTNKTSGGASESSLLRPGLGSRAFNQDLVRTGDGPLVLQ
jgi:hypothetical protein